MTDGRLAELAEKLAALEDRVAGACAVAGRARSEVTVIAVSKTWPAADVLRLSTLGVRDFGESYDREAAAKVGALRAAAADVRWHFVGQLQRNKARSVASYATVVHSVDRASLAEALGSAARRAGRDLDVFVQVSLDPPEAGARRGGVAPSGLIDLADEVAASRGLRLAGVMAIPPFEGPSDRTEEHAARPFARLRELAEQVRAHHPGATAISAGMSHDLEVAIRNGATHVRVGTALFGDRPPPSV